MLLQSNFSLPRLVLVEYCMYLAKRWSQLGIFNVNAGAEVGDNILKKADVVLVARGCNAENTLFAQSICPDEINHERGDITHLFSEHMGEVRPSLQKYFFVFSILCGNHMHAGVLIPTDFVPALNRCFIWEGLLEFLSLARLASLPILTMFLMVPNLYCLCC